MQAQTNLTVQVGQLCEWSKLKFLHEEPIHEEMLTRFWKNLKGDDPNGEYQRFTTNWVEVGFQGKDPATDFRGIGILGLYMLCAITDNGSPFR